MGPIQLYYPARYVLPDVLSGRLASCRIPVLDPRLPGPGAGYPAAGPAIFRFVFFHFFSFFPVRPGFPGPVPASRLPGRPKKTKKKMFENLVNHSF